MSRDARILVPAAIVLVALCALFYGYTVDDAYISLRYAQHLAQGHGLVWNPGESPRVEGYSNFLWVLLMALAEKVAPGRAASLVGIAGVLCGLACLPLVARLARALGAGDLGVAAAVGALAAAPCFAFWTVAGLETPAFALAMLGGVLLFGSRTPWYPLALALGALLRPEGAYLFAALWLVRLIADARESRLREAVTRAARDGLIFAAVFLPFLAWRWSYYGSLLPNTVRAKFLAFGGAAYYLWDVVRHFPLQLAALVAVFFLPGTTGKARMDRLPLLLLPALIAASLVNCVPTMGYYFRFFWPVLPLAFVAAGLCLDAIGQRWRPIAIALLLGLLAYPLFWIRPVLSTVRSQSSILAHAHRPLAEWVNHHERNDALLAVSDCGLIPYVARVNVLDLFGLNDVSIARNGFSAESVLDRRPDLIVVTSGSTRDVEPLFPWEAALVSHPRFSREYRWVRTFDASPYSYHLWLFERAERAARPIARGTPTGTVSTVPGPGRANPDLVAAGEPRPTRSGVRLSRTVPGEPISGGAR